MYARNIGGKELTFGVSGMLYRSNVLMYDRQTESLWLQVKRKAVTGPMTGTKLKVLPSAFTSWEKWLNKHPDTAVLTSLTGHVRNYSIDPYEDYYKSRRGFLSMFKPGPGEEEKELVAGIEVGDAKFAFPLKALRSGEKRTATLSGKKITAVLEEETDQIKITDSKGSTIPHVLVYWFVWKGIHPETGRFK